MAFFCLLAVLLVAASPNVIAAPDETCLACHADPSLEIERGGRKRSLHVDPKSLSGSVHAKLACVDCHAGFDPESLPHAKTIAPVDCLACHVGPAASHGFHAAMQPPRGEDLVAAPASCKTCHGTHEVQRPRPGARTAPAGASPADPGRAGEPPSPGGVQSAAPPGESCTPCHEDIVAVYRASEHGKAAAAGVRAAPDCVSCHTHPITAARSGPDVARLKVAQETVCLSCHLEEPEVRARMAPTAGFISAYQGSVHGLALLGGNGRAANCVDCHGSHTVAHGFDPKATVSRARIPATCAKCHEAIAREYASSVHGRALARGNHQAPVCTSCHGEHTIYRHDDPRSPVAARNLSSQVCSPCHASVQLSQKYGMPKDRPESYATSYHGLALRSGSVEAANCASCHGTHGILPSRDPASSVHKTRLPETCGKCHPGANARFAVGRVHVVVSESGEPLLYWISTLYLGMILVTIGGMFAHNLLDFVRKSRRHLKVRRGEIEEEPAGRGLYLRMSLSERFQHGSLVVSFTVLVVTGFMLRYPDASWVAWIRGLRPDLFPLRSVLHRSAAVMMVLASVWHVVYCAGTARGRSLVRDLLPCRRDVTDALGVLRYNLGFSRSKPSFGRFSYIEKSEYWALVWGTAVMVVTGFLMWFENASIDVIGKLGWDVTRTIHFYEAWLATLAILVWHIYYVVFNPDVYPMNMAWLTGHLTEAEMEEEHGLELEEIRKAEQRAEEAAIPDADTSPAASNAGKPRVEPVPADASRPIVVDSVPSAPPATDAVSSDPPPAQS